MLRLRTHRRSFFRKLRVLNLESRITPAITSTFDEVHGAFSVTSDGADTITIGTNEFSRLTVNGTAFVTSLGTPIDAAQVRSISVKGGPGNNVIDLSDIEPLAFAGIRPIRVELKRVASGGEDRGNNVNWMFGCSIDGGGGADTVTGSQLGDYIECTSGADVVDAGFGDDMICIRNDDISALTINGGWGYNALAVAYAPAVGATMSAAHDVGTGGNTITYGGKTVVGTGFSGVDLLAGMTDPDIQLALSDSSGGGPGGGGTIDLAHVSGSDRQTMTISDAAGNTRLKWTEVVCKRGITSSMDAWKWRVDPSNMPADIECTGAGNSLTVNTFGLSSSTSTSSVEVAGMAPITFSGMSAVSTETRLYDTAAIADLKAKGVTFSTSTVEEIDGSITQSVTLTNSGTATATNVTETWSNGFSVEQRFRSGTKYWKYSVDKFSGFVKPTSGPGVTVVVIDDSATQPRTAPQLALGEVQDTTVTFGLPDLGPGQSSTNSVSTKGNSDGWLVAWEDWRLQATVGGIKHDIDLSSYFEKGDKPTQQQFAAVIDSATGKTPSGGPTTVLGTNATGSVALVSSTASGIDSKITTLTAGAHIYLAKDMADGSFDGFSSGNAPAGKADMDLTGRYVVFESSATNLVAGLTDTNGATDIFVRDMLLSKTYCLSSYGSAMGPTTGNGASFDPQISGDGRCVIFRTSATDLIAGVTDNNNEPDLIRINRAADDPFGITIASCVSLVPNSVPSQTCDKGVIVADMNGDAHADYTIAYLTDATNTGAPPSTGGFLVVPRSNVPIKEFVTLLALKTIGVKVSEDGGTVVVWTDADVSSLTGIPDTNGVNDVVAMNVETGFVTAVTKNTAGTGMADGPSPAHAGESVAVSVDGSHIAFTSASSNLIAGLTAPATDGVYRYLLRAGVPIRFDTSTGSYVGDYGIDNHDVTISGDGLSIAWNSTTDYKTGGPSSTTRQTWVKKCYDGDAVSKGAIPISYTLADTTSDAASIKVMFSTDGGVVFFSSNAANIVTGDTNGQTDVFSSSRHHSYVFQSSLTTSPAVTVALDQSTPSATITLKDAQGVVVASQPVTFARQVYIYGRDGVDDNITIDMPSGLTQFCDRIYIFGGTGNDKVTFIGTPGAISETEISGGADGVASLRALRVPDGPVLFSDGSSRTISAVVAFACTSGIESMEDKLDAPNVVIHAMDDVTSVTRVGKNTKVTSASFNSEVFPLVVGNRTRIILTAGDDSCTVDADAATPGAPLNLEVIGNGGSDTITAKYGAAGKAFVLDGSRSIDDGVIQGSAGNDTILIGGSGTFTGGAGNDVYKCYPAYQPHPQVAESAGDDDGIDFSSNGLGVVFNMDLQTPQSYMPNGTITVTGVLEDAVGSPFDDSFTVKALSVPRTLDGGREVSTSGDTLIVDAQGKAATVVGGQVRVAGMAPISFTNFELVSIINNSSTLQVALVEINDGAIQRSRLTKIVVAFNGPVTFPNGADKAFRVDNNAPPMAIVVTPADDSGFTHVTITFPSGAPEYGSLPDGKYTLHVLGNEFSSPLGAFDGNGDGVIDPVSDDYASPPYLVYRLFGDGNADRIVNQQDFIAFRNAFNNGPSAAFDFEGNDNVTQTDFIQFRNRFNVPL